MHRAAIPAVETLGDSVTRDLARESVYRFLAAAFADPHTDGWAERLNPSDQQIFEQAVELLRAELALQPISLASYELPPEQLETAGVLAELRRPLAELRVEYNRVFGFVVPRKCPPYETEFHVSGDDFFRAQQLADIAGFYRAFGLELSSQRSERVDHLCVELEFMAFVLWKRRSAMQVQEGTTSAERVRLCDEAQRKFFAEHLAWWVPAFTMGLRRQAGSGFYASVAHFLAAFIPWERLCLGVPATTAVAQPTLIEPPEEQPECAACPLRS